MRTHFGRTILARAALSGLIASMVFGCVLFSAADGPRADDVRADAEGPLAESGSDIGAPADSQADAADPRDGSSDVFDAGCGQAIAVDFTKGLPPQASETKDAIGSTLVYDMTGVGGRRAMHVTVPLGATHAYVTINIATLASDGAKACPVACGADVRLLKRGSPGATTTELTMLGASVATIAHSSTFTYFSRGALPEAPDLGPLSPAGAFTRLALSVSGTVAPFAGVGSVGAATNTKTLGFFPTSARIGLEKAAADPEVEAIFDDVWCRSRLP